MDLPENFTESMKDLLGSEYDDFIRSYDNSPVSGLRVNTCKISCDEFERIAPYGISKIPFTENGYYISDTDEWSKHPYYFAGLYYLQEPSAMLPATVLPVVEGDRVLDLCAAPGGKSTQLICRHPALLVSNDISHSRTIPLVKNLELFGNGQYSVTCCDPADLAQRLPMCFDKILVDAPCSGEGMFRRDPGLVRAYRDKGPESYGDIQSRILENAYDMLRPGGYMLYSTCTFSDIEDEQVILRLLGKHSDLSVCDIRNVEGLSAPYGKYDNDPIIAGCAHAFPHKIKGEGHFLTLIHKEGEYKRSDTSNCEGFISFNDLPGQILELFRFLTEEALAYVRSKRFLMSKDGYIYMLPDSFGDVYDKSIRYVRTGTCIGSINKNGKFNVHTAFALALKSRDFSNRISFAAADPDVYKYLKGETLVLDEALTPGLSRGYVLVCVDDHPLGFAKYDSNKLKNLYEKGWVYR